MNFDSLSDEAKQLLSNLDEQSLIKLIKDGKARELMGEGKVKKRQFCASIPEPLYINFTKFCSLEGEFADGEFRVSAAGAITQLLVMFLRDKNLRQQFYREYTLSGNSRKKPIAGLSRKNKDDEE